MDSPHRPEWTQTPGAGAGSPGWGQRRVGPPSLQSAHLASPASSPSWCTRPPGWHCGRRPLSCIMPWIERSDAWTITGQSNLQLINTIYVITSKQKLQLWCNHMVLRNLDVVLSVEPAYCDTPEVDFCASYEWVRSFLTNRSRFSDFIQTKFIQHLVSFKPCICWISEKILHSLIL